MTITREDVVNTRTKLLKEMHEAIINWGDEDIYLAWVTLAVPDEPREDDFRFIAEDDEQWLDCCEVFSRCYVANKETGA